jgi:alpha-1,6-mannosyltransferase
LPNFSKTSCLAISLLCYLGIAYFIERDQTIVLLSLFSILFVAYFFVVKNLTIIEFQFLLFAGVLFRIIFLSSTPTLSDDFYRFIWDGSLLLNSINPFGFLPTEVLENGLIESTPNNKHLLQSMNSPAYYSVYPPILQFIFYIAVKFSFGSNLIAIMILRLFIVSAEIGSIIFIKKILVHFNLNPLKALIYWLNPLVVIELTGNLHFEGVMIFFVLAAFYFLLKNKLNISAIVLAISIATKLIPLIFLPLIINTIGEKKGIIYSAIVFLVCCLLFWGFLDKQVFVNINTSLSLYFQNFEFNASIYYVLRWFGYQFYGYNSIATIGKILPAICTSIVLILSFKNQKNCIKTDCIFPKALNILFVYYLFALIVHPWYVCFLLVISVFTNTTYIIVWSAFVFITYTTYASAVYYENLFFIFIEYAIVITFFYLNQKNRFLQDSFLPVLNR